MYDADQRIKYELKPDGTRTDAGAVELVDADSLDADSADEGDAVAVKDEASPRAEDVKAEASPRAEAMKAERGAAGKKVKVEDDDDDDDDDEHALRTESKVKVESAVQRSSHGRAGKKSKTAAAVSAPVPLAAASRGGPTTQPRVADVPQLPDVNERTNTAAAGVGAAPARVRWINTTLGIVSYGEVRGGEAFHTDEAILPVGYK